MPESDDYATELRGETDEDAPLNEKKGNDWIASIVGGILVGVIVATANRYFSAGADDAKTLVEVQKSLSYLSAQVKQLTEQPHVRRDEFRERIDSIEGRVSGLEKRVDSFQLSAGRDGR